jgi:hypothetical protein
MSPFERTPSILMLCDRHLPPRTIMDQAAAYEASGVVDKSGSRWSATAELPVSQRETTSGFRRPSSGVSLPRLRGFAREFARL